MTHTLGLAQVGLRIGRWMLPLLAAILVSATLAHAVDGVIGSGSSFVTAVRCVPIGTGYGSYVDSSIVAESRKIDCGWAP